VRPARTADAAAIARIHVASWRTTYAGLIPADFLAGMSARAQQSRWSEILSAQGRATFVYVVESDGEVVGFASGGREREGNPRYSGELYAVYLLQEQQGKGLGRKLFEAVAGRLADTGHRAMLVWVLAANSAARGFYEHLGGSFLGDARHHVAGLQVDEASYGWSDLEQFSPGRAWPAG
jgi:GNAT superfamily N-acetyltransferase